MFEKLVGKMSAWRGRGDTALYTSDLQVACVVEQ